MSDEVLGDRRIALEEEFFKAESARLREQLHEKREKAEAVAALAEASGLHDEAILSSLVEKSIDASTFAAFSLVPLIEVAWADRKLEQKERDALVKAAEEGGVAAGTPAHDLLESWLSNPPPSSLLVAWENFTAGLCESLDDDGKAKLRESVLGRARAVADAAGGFLGLTSSISDVEQEMLDRLARAFS